MAADPQNLIFGKYELIRRLALGGMGEVFLARQTGGVTGTERLVILKSLLPELAEQDGFIDQFLDEARVAAKLNHPNVVQMLEAGLWNGMYFIAMEYIKGENLSRIQKTAKAKGLPFPIHIVVRVIRDALNGLGHAHGAIDDQTGQPLCVVHRDVSPQNIMVRIDGVTKVVDFGIAKSGNRSSRTATGVLKGKLQFMSPEQVKGENVDARTDQFAMGIVLWELLTNQRLFAGDNEIAILKAVLQQRIPKPSEHVPGLPPELEMVIMKMLERDPNQRYASCEEAADGLSAWLAQGSRRVSENDVAGFIKAIVGDNVEEQTRNSGLSGDQNFLLNLHHTPSKGTGGGPTPETSPTVMRRMEATQARKMAGVGIGVGAIAAIALAIGVVVVIGAEDPPLVAPVVVDAGKAAVVAAPVEAPRAPAPPPRAVRVAAGMLEIELADPTGAAVIVDGKAWPERVPTTLKLPAGPHKIAVVDATGVQREVPVVLAPPVVEVTSDPPGASIIVAGSSFGITPARLTKLNGGATHELTLKKDGYTLKKILVENLLDGEQRTLAVTLDKMVGKPATPPPTPTPTPTPTPVAASSEPGTLIISTTPASKVFIDGVFAGQTPFFNPIAMGKHTVVLENVVTGDKRTKQITVTAGEREKISETW
ncbi:MAG: serine/threonine-protein kinase [Deltaproteobacteria bacterium]|nr:serine/threonine-protein kinase [Deltaproteobacteria bacterium]